MNRLLLVTNLYHIRCKSSSRPSDFISGWANSSATMAYSGLNLLVGAFVNLTLLNATSPSLEFLSLSPLSAVEPLDGSTIDNNKIRERNIETSKFNGPLISVSISRVNAVNEKVQISIIITDQEE